MFFSFSPTEILYIYIFSRVLLYVLRFNFSFCVNNGLEKKKKKKKRCRNQKYKPRGTNITMVKVTRDTPTVKFQVGKYIKSLGAL